MKEVTFHSIYVDRNVVTEQAAIYARIVFIHSSADAHLSCFQVMAECKYSVQCSLVVYVFLRWFSHIILPQVLLLNCCVMW